MAFLVSILCWNKAFDRSAQGVRNMYMDSVLKDDDDVKF